jgi:hypothetical protein
VCELRLQAAALGDVAEAEHPPDDRAVHPLRLRVPLDDAPVGEVQHVRDRRVRRRIPGADVLQERLGVDQLPRHAAEHLPRVAARRELGREIPHLEQLAVVAGHAAGLVDDEDRVGGRLERGLEQGVRVGVFALGPALRGDVPEDREGRGQPVVGRAGGDDVDFAPGAVDRQEAVAGGDRFGRPVERRPEGGLAGARVGRVFERREPRGEGGPVLGGEPGDHRAPGDGDALGGADEPQVRGVGVEHDAGAVDDDRFGRTLDQLAVLHLAVPDRRVPHLGVAPGLGVPHDLAVERGLAAEGEAGRDPRGGRADGDRDCVRLPQREVGQQQRLQRLVGEEGDRGATRHGGGEPPDAGGAGVTGRGRGRGGCGGAIARDRHGGERGGQ